MGNIIDDVEEQGEELGVYILGDIGTESDAVSCVRSQSKISSYRDSEGDNCTFSVRSITFSIGIGWAGAGEVKGAYIH